MRAWSEEENRSPWKLSFKNTSQVTAKRYEKRRPDLRGCVEGRREPAQHAHRRVTISHPGDVDRAAAARTAARQRWVILRCTEWRLAPNSSSAKIGDLEPGRQVTQIACAQLSAMESAWCPIEPRGFVSFEDLAVVQEEPAGSDNSELGDLEGREERLNLHEENLRLRESNLDLKEQKMKAQSEVDALFVARKTAAQELEQLRALRASEQASLECCQQERRRLEEKLLRCSKVVATTVRAMDRLHGDGAAADGADDEVLMADVSAAGAAVRESLLDIYDDGDTDVPRCGSVGAPLQEPAGGSEENVREQAKALSSKKMSTSQSRIPLKALNSIR